MLAVIKSGGKQYIVREGDEITVEKIKGKEGAKVTFSVLLLVDDKGKVRLGTPVLAKAKVEGKVLKHSKSKKVVVFKMKPKKRYRRKAGHRQGLTTVKIEKISA